MVSAEVVEDFELSVAAEADPDIGRLRTLFLLQICILCAFLKVQFLQSRLKGAIVAEVKTAYMTPMPLLKKGEVFQARRIGALLQLDVWNLCIFWLCRCFWRPWLFSEHVRGTLLLISIAIIALEEARQPEEMAALSFTATGSHLSVRALLHLLVIVFTVSEIER